LGDFDAAMADYTRAIELDETYAAGYNSICWLKTTELGEHESALDDCNRALELDPEAYYIYDSRCWVKKNLGDYQGAVEDCTIALSGEPDIAESHLSLGDVYYTLGDYEAALMFYNGYLEYATPELLARYDYVQDRLDEMILAMQAESR
jgi:tetratricopeptide (TPR) repeat protein